MNFKNLINISELNREDIINILKYADQLNTYGFDIDSDLPAVFTLNGELFLSAKKINSCTTLDELINEVRVKIRFHKEN